MVKKADSSTKQTKVMKAVQPEINIGLVGHVDHGKTTLTERLSGIWTDTHSEELKRGITIRLGYANTTFYKCQGCDEELCYGTSTNCPKCKGKTISLRKVSFIDAPGHETLMATMLSGAAIMDGALLIIAANEDCPRPQTREHLMALELIGIKNIVIVQNKIDLVSEEQAIKNYEQIKTFVKGSIAESAPIIPISAQHSVNIGALIRAIETHIKTPKRDSSKNPVMYIARSFDVNKPGTKIDDLVGGVLGGAIVQGVLKIKDKIEIGPGRKIEKHGKTTWEKIITEIVDIKTGKESLKEGKPGGSLGILTTLDPAVVKSNNLTGNVVGHINELPDLLEEIVIKIKLLQRVVGAKDELIVSELKKGEPLLLNINATATVGVISDISNDKATLKLKLPVCAPKGSRTAISRQIGTRWRLIGIGELI